MARRKGKRAAGTGSIVRLANGDFRAKFPLGNGRYKESTKRTQREAVAALREMEQRHERGVDLRAKRQTVAQFAARWLDDVAAQRVRPQTIESYRLHMQRITKYIGHIDLAKLNAPDVQHALMRLHRDDNLAPRTVNVTRTILVAALTTAEAWDLISRNVAARTSPLATTPPHIVVLNPGDAQRVCEAADAEGIGVAVRLALYLGMRSGEVLGLRWRDVDLAKHQLHIAVALQRAENGYVLVTPKTASSTRTLPLPPSIVAAFHHQRAHQAEQRLRAGMRWQDHGLVVTTQIGTPLGQSPLRVYWRRVLERAGLPPMRFHDLRHSCASLLAAQGVHPKRVQTILGHSTITTTLALYTHLLDDNETAAALHALDTALLGEQDDLRAVG